MQRSELQRVGVLAAASRHRLATPTHNQWHRPHLLGFAACKFTLLVGPALGLDDCGTKLVMVERLIVYKALKMHKGVAKFPRKRKAIDERCTSASQVLKASQKRKALQVTAEEVRDCKAPCKRDKTNGDMLERLQCPVCFEIMYPPIMQCLQGHPICNSCCRVLDQRRFPKCPTCRDTLRTPARALNLEQMAENVQVPCKHCGASCKYGEYIEHIQTCGNNWEAAWDPHIKKWYYMNPQEGKASWKRPIGCSLTLPSEPPKGKISEFAELLPEGWRAGWCVSHQRFYFYNHATQERTWIRPVMRSTSV